MRNELNEDTERLFTEFWEEQAIKDPEIENFAKILAEGTIKNLPAIDEKISGAAINWSIKRMPCLDKNILRMATFEMLFLEDIPVLVSINEAIELAKKYSAEDSPRFINGVLHKIKEDIKKVRICRQAYSNSVLSSPESEGTDATSKEHRVAQRSSQ